MIIRVKEKRPGGPDSFEGILNKIRVGASKADDMRPVWPEIISEIKKTYKYEFSDANPAGWMKLNEDYKAWKIKKGYPPTIGIMTGSLKKAMTDSSAHRKEKTKLVYDMGEVTNPRTKQKTSDYAKHFHEDRNITDYTSQGIRSFLKSTVKRAIKEGFNWK